MASEKKRLTSTGPLDLRAMN